jgi:hypothetical protein
MNDPSELSLQEQFEWGREAIGKGNLSGGLDTIRAAAFEGHPEALVVSNIV